MLRSLTFHVKTLYGVEERGDDDVPAEEKVSFCQAMRTIGGTTFGDPKLWAKHRLVPKPATREKYYIDAAGLAALHAEIAELTRMIIDT